MLFTWLLLQAAAPTHERANLRNQRYCEVLLVDRHFLSVSARVYNTIGLNECPADQWAALNAGQLTKEKNVSAVILNGPRYFVMDRNALNSAAGGIERFGNLEMRLLATLEITGMRRRAPYVEHVVDRESQYVYDAGKSVYELLAPDGRRYIMQSYSQEIDKSLDEAALLHLAGRLKLPRGWQYRARKLDQELVVRNAGGQAYVVQDDLRNSYQRMQ